MTKILAIDPGTTESGWVILDDDGTPLEFGKSSNDAVLGSVYDCAGNFRVVVEMVASYGMSVGAEVFETCVWIGRFVEASDGFAERIYRRDVKLHLCGVTNAKDGNIRQALIDRFGPGKAAAIGLKATPGPLYGMSGDMWQALALAVTAHDGGAK